VSDAGNDAFYVYNATAADGRFAPAFSGYLDSASTSPSIALVGHTSAANDTGTTPLILITADRTSSATDPNNGTLSGITTRPLLQVVSNGVAGSGIQIQANGTLLVGKTTDSSDGKVQVAGGASFTGAITSTLATGTAPFTVASTTRVANLNVATAGTADTVSAIDGQTATVTKIPIAYSNNSDFTTTSTTFVDATGLSFPVLANKNYALSLHLLTNKNDANGLQIQITGPASPTKLFYRITSITTGLTASVTDNLTAFSTPSTTGNTFNGDGWICINPTPFAFFSNGANAGTVRLQLRAVTGGTAKIYAGSWIQVTQLN